MLTFQTESYVKTLEDGLYRDHQAETDHRIESSELNPDLHRYGILETNGSLLCFTVRDDAKLVGFSRFLINYNLHYQHLRSAVNDSIYLHPDYRQGYTGSKLIRYSEQEIIKHGVDAISWCVKFNTESNQKRDFSHILHRMGYFDEEKVVTKRVSQWPHYFQP